MEFGIIIPNRYPDIIAPLVRSFAQFEPDVRVIVIANGHANGYGFEMLPLDDPFIYSKAANLGMRALDPLDVILLNDDCVLLENRCLTRLAYLGKAHENAGILSPLIKGCAGNPLQRWHEREKYWTPHQVIQHQLGTMPICFPCVWIARKLIDRIGLMDETVTNYGRDDDEYCNRARAAGFFTSVTSWVTVQHGDGGVELGEGRGKTWSLSFARRLRGHD